MNTDLVFSRTQKGNFEINSRKHQLPMRLRTVLILVDGTSNVNQLRDKASAIPEFESFLEDLALDGFISAQLPSWDRRLEIDKRGKYEGADRRSRDGSGDSTFTGIRARLIDTAILTFGDGAENAVKKFRKASSDWQGLENAITECAKLAGLVYDDSTASQFKTKCWRILSKALRSTPSRL
ncbi:MAG: hypothetical protein OES46_08995 [Gammaproteobacteria bacterium]|jgi:hypothetical protein|nr:hypothetical protein [Gammaproteobacteria bacterium]